MKTKTKLTVVASNKVATGAYKGHREGSKKGAVHRVFDQKGRDAALQYGRMRKLKASTLNQWFNTWTRASKKAA